MKRLMCERVSAHKSRIVEMNFGINVQISDSNDQRPPCSGRQEAANDCWCQQQGTTSTAASCTSTEWRRNTTQRAITWIGMKCNTRIGENWPQLARYQKRLTEANNTMMEQNNSTWTAPRLEDIYTNFQRPFFFLGTVFFFLIIDLDLFYFDTFLAAFRTFWLQRCITQPWYIPCSVQ